jgi:hypothetical protein
MFAPSQGSAYGRLRRALDTGNPTIALAAAAELDFVSLPDALELLLLLVDDPKRFRRRRCAGMPATAPRFQTWASRRRTPCSPAWPAWRVGGRGHRRRALAELVHGRGLERASEVLVRWAS